ncbi:MAG: heterodisulfide reductase-related iron-sulfur binding cluster [Bacteroidota bacterium]
METLIFALILLASLVSFSKSSLKLIKLLKLGKSENRFDQIGKRFGRFFLIGLAQKKLLQDPIPGILHIIIFWGFLALSFAALESIIEGFVAQFSFSFLGTFYSVITFSQELFCAIVVVAVVLSLWRRFISKIPRLQVDKYGKIDAALILVWIFFIVSSLLFQNSARISLGVYESNLAHPISKIISVMFSNSNQTIIYEKIFWWIHISLILAFMVYLPKSKHLHVLTSLPNVFFSNLKPKGSLKPINLSDETLTKFGATDVVDLNWKQLLDGYTCTECGRCDSVCPANTTGKKLSPRKIIVDTRHRSMQLGLEPNDELKSKTLLDNFITEDELWACTTCMACVYECPVMIEHVDEIVDLRRGLVLNESRFPNELRVTFENLERNFTPWAFSHSTRADWSNGLNIAKASETNDFDILFWVGCAGAYDARYQKVTKAFSSLMQKANIKFAILGVEEKCTGDAPRRMGNEYLAQTLMMENIDTMNRYKIKKIVTTCPHCFHSLAKEYPQFGGNFEVIHHTDFLMGLVKTGALKISKSKQATITYHDSCYLARYNDVVESPREVLKSIPELKIVEMPRSKQKGFCCGAGGGRMWMEEKEGKRINIERTEEALATNADTIGTACPFCLTMMNDGVKAKEASEKVQVKDIAEILLEVIE